MHTPEKIGFDLVCSASSFPHCCYRAAEKRISVSRVPQDIVQPAIFKQEVFGRCPEFFQHIPT